MNNPLVVIIGDVTASNLIKASQMLLSLIHDDNAPADPIYSSGSDDEGPDGSAVRSAIGMPAPIEVQP